MAELVATLIVSFFITIASLFNTYLAEKALKSFRDGTKEKAQKNEEKEEEK